ncbi:PP0621 family protein [Rubrivivax rivuli]|uniref:Uncharacterized protein n=1 Tax=Rubrivivax rivuli TaxID=1862385 RepID=A0A437R9D1_9BURK|nr:PP0621 family protein [Rubrivivax rivuli]RVU43391.1 hypothetical protein EOE66_20865 [Rubrivivax rivuli]
MKYLLLLAVAALALWWFKRRSAEPPSKPPPAPPKPAARPPSTEPLVMVACAHCGVHLPQSDATTDASGRPYCGEAHRAAGPR